MNREAINLFASKNVVEGVADWPPWAYAVDFWAYYPWPVSHSESGSVIDKSRSLARGKLKNRSRYVAAALAYMTLFGPRKVQAHSQSLGGLRAYLNRVIVPSTRHYIARFRWRKA